MPARGVWQGRVLDAPDPINYSARDFGAIDNAASSAAR